MRSIFTRLKLGGAFRITDASLSRHFSGTLDGYHFRGRPKTAITFFNRPNNRRTQP